MAMPWAKTTLEQWTVLAAVVDHGSFSQAAAALHRSQPAISYALSHLQEALDLQLLVLDGRKAVLTAEGQTMLKRVRPLLQELHDLEHLARMLKQGWEAQLSLVVDAAFPRERLLGILVELRKSCPETQVRLADAILSGAEDAITQHTADIIVTTRVPQGFLGENLLDVVFVAVATPAHPLFALDRELTAEDLVRHPQAVMRDSGTKHPRDDGWLGSNQQFTVTSMDAALATVVAGLAYAWLPEHLIRSSLQAGTLRPLPLIPGGKRTVPLHLVLSRPQLAGPAARAAVQLFQREARQTRNAAESGTCPA